MPLLQHIKIKLGNEKYSVICGNKHVTAVRATQSKSNASQIEEIYLY